MKKFAAVFCVILSCAIGAAVLTPTVEAMLQRPVSEMVSGATSAGIQSTILVDSDGTVHTTGTGTVTGTVAVNMTQLGGVTGSVNNGTADTGTQRVAIASDNTAFKVRGTPAMTGYTTQATFTTNGLFLLQNTATNQATATTTLLQSVILTNNTPNAVLTQVMDGNGRYLLGPSFSIAANSQYVLNVPSGALMTSGVNVSANTANALTATFWGLQ